MGYAIAAEAARRGAHVTLVTGPTSYQAPPVADVVRTRSAADMLEAVRAHAPHADVVVMAAAVADYTPVERAAQKVPKDSDTLTLTLKRTTDILKELGQQRLKSGSGPILV